MPAGFQFDNHTVIAAFVIILGLVLVLAGELTGSAWAQLATVIFGTLVGGNAVMHTATQVASARAAP